MQFSKEILKGSIEVIVLQALHELGEAYGYQLVTAIQEMSGGTFEFQESTLYPLLYRLEEKSFLKSHRQKAPSGKERRYYSLTAKGTKVLSEKRFEIGQFVLGMNKLLNLGHE
ncbi:MAG: helix-turn-helix transcriptional regulator [Patescibacteria group bacterium]